MQSCRDSAWALLGLCGPAPPARRHKRCAKQLFADPPWLGNSAAAVAGGLGGLAAPFCLGTGRLLEGHRQQVALLNRATLEAGREEGGAAPHSKGHIKATKLRPEHAIYFAFLPMTNSFVPSSV